MISSRKIDNLIVQIDGLDKYEIKHLEGYIAKKLGTLDNLYIENSKLTDAELEFIRSLLKSQ